ncbi:MULTISPECIES: hypothetical protein [Pectobacterium]|uniref:hypothetical protein n=1 Tax=Pectobacterium TaxID=122277 RepID=UPI001C2E4693|nr:MULTISPECIES: hypothetical protein [Pectobacterium]MCY9847240.1 hypothetical protein [Pectobacterium jejuense]
MIPQNLIVVEQVEKHGKYIALKGDLLETMKQAVVQAVRKEGDIAKTLLKKTAGDGKLRWADF